MKKMSYNNKTMASYQTDLQSLEGLKAFIAGGRSKEFRTIANNTVARLVDGGAAIRLHQTDIVTFFENDDIRLDSGGWLTVTTKERLNRYTKAGISQRAGVWYMSDGSLFYDGIIIRGDGSPVKPKKPDNYEKKLKDIKKRAKTYAKNYVQALKDGKIDYPSGGDCWACLGMVRAGDTYHLEAHIKEKYYVPTLLVNAGRAAGYRDEQIGLMGMGGRRVFIDPERVLYRYIVKELRKGL